MRDYQKSVEANPLWWALSKFLDERIVLLLAARADVQNILQHERKQRITYDVYIELSDLNKDQH